MIHRNNCNYYSKYIQYTVMLKALVYYALFFCAQSHSGSTLGVLSQRL